MGNRRYALQTKWIIGMLVFIMLLSPAGMAAAEEQAASEEDRLLLERYWEIYQYLKEYHISGPSGEQLSEGAINGMLRALGDPYTYYMTEEEQDGLLHSIDGDWIGIGVVLHAAPEGIRIEELIPGSPAAGSGLQAGDVLVEVNGTALTAQTTLDEVLQLIAGAKDTVALTVERWRNQQKSVKTIDVKPKQMQLPLTEARMLDGTVGYLKLRSFGTETSSQLSQGLEELRAAGMKQLVLDLRGNAGGLLDAAAQAAKLFRPSGVLLHMKDHTGAVQPYSFEDGTAFSEPLAVLVDAGSASAAEVLAGFLQDSGVGSIVGGSTFGKGTIQNLIQLQSGGVLRLTVQEYFTPDLHAVHNRGIQPDVPVDNRSFRLGKAYGSLTGKNELHIGAEGEVRLNGLSEASLPNETFKQDGRLYLSVRTLMEWFDGQVEWDGAAGAVVAELQGAQATLHRGHPALKLVNSKSFVDVELLPELLPLTVSRDGALYIVRQAPTGQ